MSPSINHAGTSFHGAPRVSGDEPASWVEDQAEVKCSPRERG